MFRNNLRAPARVPKNLPFRLARENLARKEIDNLRLQFHRRVALASCRRRNKKDWEFDEAFRPAWSYPRQMALKPQKEFRAGCTAYSSFWTCSRIFSNSALQAMTRWEMAASLAFAPSVLSSRKISWVMNSSVRPTGSLLRK